MAGSSNADLILAAATPAHGRAFLATWVPFYLAKRTLNQNWDYRFFPWDTIIEHPNYETFVAQDAQEGLEGMISFIRSPALQSASLYVGFLAAAPWNYGEDRARRGIGTGLLSVAISKSIAAGHSGALILSSTPEAETFYERLAFHRTGEVDDEGLPIFTLSADQSKAFARRYPPLG